MVYLFPNLIRNINLFEISQRSIVLSFQISFWTENCWVILKPSVANSRACKSTNWSVTHCQNVKLSNHAIISFCSDFLAISLIEVQVVFVLKLTFSKVVFICSIYQNNVVTRFFHQTHFVRFVPWLTTKINQTPFFKERVQSQDWIDISTQVSSARSSA